MNSWRPPRASTESSSLSYRWHARGAPDSLIASHEQYERLARAPEERQAAYRALFALVPDPTGLLEIRGTIQHDRPLGNERFRNEIEAAPRAASEAGSG